MRPSLVAAVLFLLGCQGPAPNRPSTEPEVGVATDSATLRQRQLAAITARFLATQDTINGQFNLPGRFQVINGTPGFARNIMLLDSQSGRTWVLCTVKDSTTATDSNWCAMSFFGAANPP